MHILLVRYVIDVKVSEPLSYMDCCVVIGYQVFMSDFVLPMNLFNDEL